MIKIYTRNKLNAAPGLLFWWTREADIVDHVSFIVAVAAEDMRASYVNITMLNSHEILPATFRI